MVVVVVVVARVPRSSVGALHGGYVGSYVGLDATAGVLGCARRGAGGGSCSGATKFYNHFLKGVKKITKTFEHDFGDF